MIHKSNKRWAMVGSTSMSSCNKFRSISGSKPECVRSWSGPNYCRSSSGSNTIYKYSYSRSAGIGKSRL